MCTSLGVLVHSHDSLILSLSVPNGAASGTALYYLSGPVNSKPITHSECVYVCTTPHTSGYVCVCLCVRAIVRHHCHALPHVNITRKRDTLANCVAGMEIHDRGGLELLLPTCQRSGIHFTAALHVHSKPNETLHSFPRLSPPLVS